MTEPVPLLLRLTGNNLLKIVLLFWNWINKGKKVEIFSVFQVETRTENFTENNFFRLHNNKEKVSLLSRRS